jgi:hypothetical protein
MFAFAPPEARFAGHPAAKRTSALKALVEDLFTVPCCEQLSTFLLIVAQAGFNRQRFAFNWKLGTGDFIPVEQFVKISAI